MSDPHDRTPDPLGDFFDNVPSASPPAESESRGEPAPGSRRALREAAAREAASRGASPGADAEDDVPGPPASPRAATDGAAPAIAGADTGASQQSAAVGSLESLFVPDASDGPAHRRRGRGSLIWLIILLIIGGGIAAGAAWVYTTYQAKIDDVMGWGEPKDYEPGIATDEAFVTIRQGDTGSPVSTALYEAKVTKTEDVFYDYLIENDPNVTFYPGVYRLQKKMTAAAALKALQNPESRMANSVRIEDGSTVESSLPRIAEGVGIALDDLKAATQNPSAYGVSAPSLEGWLFPAIYEFDPGVTAEQAIAAMVDRTRVSLADAGVPDDQQQRVLTIASIIEREARTPDFAKVSRVIANRIDDGMMLQMDSTAQYGFGELHAGKASTSEEAQHDDNAWNTYVIAGLPATPIANPGAAAIDAAMHPADGPWLYFVTIDLASGETQFSVTYEEHQQGIKKMRAWCASHDYKGC